MARFKFDPRLVLDVAVFLGASASIFYLVSHILSQGERSPEARRKTKASLQRLKESRPDLKLTLDEYEQTIVSQLVLPADIKVRFADIGGLDDILEDLRESVLYPLTVPALYAHHSTLLQAPKGVLLYGPPGCGKTMMAKALAAESGANFININMSTIMDKWFGESNKLVAAVFSLAAKLEPCIIFIDEIDSFLRQRQSTDHEITAMLKAEFMTLWDGLTSSGRVLVLGATNRPNDIDPAILRRMPKRFAVKLPEKAQRETILKLMLRDAKVEPGFDYEELALRSAGMSGSDIREECRNAALAAMREYIRQNFKDGQHVNAGAVEVRPLRVSDFFVDRISAPMAANNYVGEV